VGNVPNCNAPKVLRKPDGFTRETDFRLATCLAWLPALAGKRVGVYGSGANARRILESAGGLFSQVVVIDDNAVGAQVCGYDVVAFSDALGENLDAIVIAAEFQPALVVARRIKRACRHKGVALYDMYGNDVRVLQDRLAAVLTQPLKDQISLLDACDVLCVNAELLSGDADVGQALRTASVQNSTSIDCCIVPLVDYAIAQGKDVVVYGTDPHLEREDVLEALARVGVTHGFVLLLAAETGLYAQNGLYRVLDDKAAGKRVVHIGFDVLKDAVIPLAYGREAVLAWNLKVDPDFYRPHGIEIEANDEVAWFSSVDGSYPATPEGRLSACAAEIAPQVEVQCGRDAARVALFVAPLIVGFVTWFVERLADREDAFDGILFASRDGYLVKEVFDCYCSHVDASPLPPAWYFLTSRKASLVGMQSRDGDGIAYRAYLDYLASCNLRAGGAYAFVEFVGGGTCQKQLEAFVPFSLRGFCFGSRVSDTLACRLGADYYFDDEDASFLSRYLHLEAYISSDEPSLVGFLPGGEPVFADELRTADELAFLRDVHAGVLLFASRYFSNWYMPGDVVSHEFVNDLLPGIDRCNAERITLYDDMTGLVQDKDIWSIIPPDQPRSSEAAPECDFPSGEPVSHSTEQPLVALASGERKKKNLLKLLSAFDVACQEFGLTYIATHGTLLGAVRHGGFVPGDEDLDVAMPRRDYDELLHLAEAGVFPEPLFIQTPENDERVFFGGFAKLRYRDSRSAGDGLETGDAWLDIMPLDNCPIDDEEVALRQRFIRQWQRTLYAQTYGFNQGKLWDVNPRKLSLYFLLADHMKRATLCKLLKGSCMSCKPTGLLTVFAGNYRRQPNTVRFAIDDVLQATRVPFEDTTIPIPRNAEAWLERYYGPDWNAVPVKQGEGD